MVSLPAPDAAMERIVERVSTVHDFDLRGYKRSTLYRRLRKRMLDTGCGSPEEYLRRLDGDPQEHAALVSTLLIHVTEFFRDPEAWEFLEHECLAPALHARPPREPVRVWSAGCATGEEAYSIAITLADLLPERRLDNVKIYATDADERALSLARAGVYTPEEMRNVPEARLRGYFNELPGCRFEVRREIRAALIFGRQNLLVDPPISRLDLLVCRNLLIYFDAETQQQILARFHYALREGGYLFLGRAETLMSRSLQFRPVEPRHRIFQRIGER